MTRGKVVLVPFPFDDLATQKARPAVCLTEPVTSHRLLTVASSIIKRDLGRLSSNLQARVADAVRRLFALESDDAGVGKTEPDVRPGN